MCEGKTKTALQVRKKTSIHHFTRLKNTILKLYLHSPHNVSGSGSVFPIWGRGGVLLWGQGQDSQVLAPSPSPAHVPDSALPLNLTLALPLLLLFQFLILDQLPLPGVDHCLWMRYKDTVPWWTLR